MTKKEIQILSAGDLIIYREYDFQTDILATVLSVNKDNVKVRDHLLINIADKGIELFTDEYGLNLHTKDILVERFPYKFDKWAELNAEYCI